MRKQRSNSLRKRNAPSGSSQAAPLSRQTSQAAGEQTFERQTSHHTQVDEDLQPTSGIADHFSLEDLPVIAHPSPNPGRRAVSVGPDDEIPDEDDQKNEVVSVSMHAV